MIVTRGQFPPFVSPKFKTTSSFVFPVKTFPTVLTAKCHLQSNPTAKKKITHHWAQVELEGIRQKVESSSSLIKSCLGVLETGAMSFGSISDAMHRDIATGVNVIQDALHSPTGRPISNSGEGGELADRHGAIDQSRTRQVASGRFGMDHHYLAHARRLQIKVNQGAKPGVGGKLPGYKVTIEVAHARLTKPGVTLISPPPNHDIYSIEDLKQLITDLRAANPSAEISVKITSREEIGCIVVGIAKCGANNISIAGPGGTGAASITERNESILPWEFGLAEAHQALIEEGLRTQVTLTVSGGIQSGEDGFKALLLGANYIELGTVILVGGGGCIKANVCHKNTCPAGVATTDEKIIQERYKGRPDKVANTLFTIASSMATYLETYGFTHPSQAEGCTHLLGIDPNTPVTGLEKLLHRPVNRYPSFSNITRHQGSSALEEAIILGIKSGKALFNETVKNNILSFGARIAYYAAKDDRFKQALSEQPCSITLNGIPGQSAGFLLPPHVTLHLTHTNDGTGKSLAGGTIFADTFGNQACYGATSGNVYTRFLGDRALVRNSGAHVVTEGLGQMAANFMAGGTLTIVASPYHYRIPYTDHYKPAIDFREDLVGPNFGASFFGGVVYMPRMLYNAMYHDGYFADSCRVISPEPLTNDEVARLVTELKTYARRQKSPTVEMLLAYETVDSIIANDVIKLDPSKQSIPTPTIHSSDKNQQIQQTPSAKATLKLLPKDQASPSVNNGLYTPTQNDACGTALLIDLQPDSSRTLVEDTINILKQMEHRGATSIDPDTGDGCGILFYGVHTFFQKQFSSLPLLPEQYAVIHIALPKESIALKRAIKIAHDTIAHIGLPNVVAQRDVPVDSSFLGFLGKESEPLLQQWIILRPTDLSLEDFDKLLVKMQWRFECLVQTETWTNTPHILSASPYFIIYKTLAREHHFYQYFQDMQHPDFKANASVNHARFATNTKTKVGNIQPFASLANNGENNALHTLVRLLENDPIFREKLDLTAIRVEGWSDSKIMAFYIHMLYVFGYSPQEIVASTIHAYHPSQTTSSLYHNLLCSTPFEGPNTSIITIGNEIIVVRDKNGFRPCVGIHNENKLYLGSELGPYSAEGRIINLPPATPFRIDLNNKTYGLCQSLNEKSLSYLKRLSSDTSQDNQAFSWSEEELKIRRLRAGWSEELDKCVMQPLFQGGGPHLTVSMGDEGPIEALAKGRIEIGALLKGKYSQVTNPPLAVNEEKNYMSTWTLVGRQPSIKNEKNKPLLYGYLLESPIVTNKQLTTLKEDVALHTHVIDMTFPANEGLAGFDATVSAIIEDGLMLARQYPHLMILLSDLNNDQHRIPIPHYYICSKIHDALQKEGLRNHVTLALQAGAILTGRDVAQAISVGGVDIVNPYLPLVQSKNGKTDPAFETKCKTYLEALRQELLGFMARMGIASVRAYRGGKVFSGVCLDPILARALDVRSTLGGVGILALMQAAINQHQRPTVEGTGRLTANQDGPRMGFWNTQTTQSFIRAGKDGHSLNETKLREDKYGTIRGQLLLSPSQHWNRHNPMTICIVGGGVAGFEIASQLLESPIADKINIVMIEKNKVNRVGLIGDGVAPDHAGTKCQEKIYRALYENPHFIYYGNIALGHDVSFDSLQTIYPCVIDCRGATGNKPLDIPGKELAMPASVVYRDYNGSYYEEAASIRSPYFTHNQQCEIGIIGHGNVAADIARIFLKEPSEFEKTSISPSFLTQLKKNPPEMIHVFVRGQPGKVRMDLVQLNALANLKDLCFIAEFSDNDTEFETMPEKEKEYYTFFKRYQNKPLPLTQQKVLIFHFEHTPLRLSKEQEALRADFKCTDGRIAHYYLKTVIAAIGHEVEKPQNISRRYSCGWRVGEGGNISAAQTHAKQVAAEIVNDFYKGIFHHLPLNKTYSTAWNEKAINNHQQLNILNYLDDGYRIETSDDLWKAKQYQKLMPSQSTTTEIKTVVDSSIEKSLPSDPLLSLPPDPDNVTVYTKDGKTKKYASSNMTLFAALTKDGLFSTSCHGAKVCGECGVEADKTIQKSKKETAILKAVNHSPDSASILACMHSLEELKGKIVKM